MNKRFTLTILTAVLTIGTAQAQTCNPSITRSAPDSRYQLVVGSGGSEVLDTQTKLIWQRCSLGQIWNGTTCIGPTSSHTWTDALKQAKVLGSTYRVPNVKELNSLVEEACHRPSINESFFPATHSQGYWSSSPVPHQNRVSWLVDFDVGASIVVDQVNSYRVRLVRDNQ